MNKVDHIGIAVRSLEETLPFYTDILGLPCTMIENIEHQSVRVAFLDANNVKIELVEPTAPTSAIANFIEKRGEGGIHHIAFNVDCIHSRIKELKAKGISMLDDVPKLGAANKLIAFMQPKSSHGVLYELCEHQMFEENSRD